jgi:oryzin
VERSTSRLLGPRMHLPPNTRALPWQEYVFNAKAGRDTYAYVVDTGIDVDHPDIQGRAQSGFSYVFDRNGVTRGHGTAVASLIGGWPMRGAISNLVSIRVDPPAPRTEINNPNYQPNFTSSSIMEGVTYAVEDILKHNRQNVSVINMSFPGTTRFPLIETLIELAFDVGIICVVAAGNFPLDAREVHPASVPVAITVGAVDTNNRMMPNSSYGPGVEVEASALRGGRLVVSGTSASAAYVSGLILYLKSIDARFPRP